MRMNYVQYFKLEAFQGQEENVETHTHPNPEKKTHKKKQVQDPEGKWEP